MVLVRAHDDFDVMPSPATTRLLVLALVSSMVLAAAALALTSPVESPARPMLHGFAVA